MKKENIKIDRIVLNKSGIIGEIDNFFLENNFKKLSDNLYKAQSTFVEITESLSETFIDIYAKDAYDIIISSFTRKYDFFLSKGVDQYALKLEQDMQNLFKEIKVERSFSERSCDSPRITKLKRLAFIFLLSLIFVVVFYIIFK